MKTKYKYMTAGGLIVIGMVSYMLHPIQTKASYSKYRIQPDLSVEAHKSDTVRVSESYERMLGKYLITIDNQIAQVDREYEVISDKLDTIETKIDGLGVRLGAIEKALNIPKQIPKPETTD